MADDLINTCPNQGFIDGHNLRPCLTCMIGERMGEVPRMDLRGPAQNGIRPVLAVHNHTEDVDEHLAEGDVRASLQLCSHFADNFGPLVEVRQVMDGFLIAPSPRS